MFDLQQFIIDCRTAVLQDPSNKLLREVVARAVSKPSDVIEVLGEPERGQLQSLHHSSELTILNVIWAPKMTLFPHNHVMPAVIGIYTGREDNIFWRRVPGGPQGRVEAVAAKSLCDKDAFSLGRDIIHSVTNPITRLTGALHVYGGDFFNAPRSEWDPETLLERRCDVERLQRIFEEENARYPASQASVSSPNR